MLKIRASRPRDIALWGRPKRPICAMALVEVAARPMESERTVLRGPSDGAGKNKDKTHSLTLRKSSLEELSGGE